MAAAGGQRHALAALVSFLLSPRPRRCPTTLLAHLPPTILQAGLKFYVYQHLKQWWHHSRPRELARTGADGKPRLPVPVMLSFGAVAGLVAQTATYPLDVVRRQMQVGEGKGAGGLWGWLVSLVAGWPPLLCMLPSVATYSASPGAQLLTTSLGPPLQRTAAGGGA